MHQQSHEAQAQATALSEQNKALTDELEALKAQLAAVHLSQSAQTEQSKAMTDELHALRADLEAAHVVAEQNQALMSEVDALKAQLAAARSCESKHRDMSASLRGQLQALEADLCTRVPCQQLSDAMVSPYAFWLFILLMCVCVRASTVARSSTIRACSNLTNATSIAAGSEIVLTTPCMRLCVGKCVAARQLQS